MSPVGFEPTISADERPQNYALDHVANGTVEGNEYVQYFLGSKGGRYVRLTTLPPSCADCPEICKHHPPGTPRACNRAVQGVLYRHTVNIRTLSERYKQTDY